MGDEAAENQSWVQMIQLNMQIMYFLFIC